MNHVIFNGTEIVLPDAVRKAVFEFLPSFLAAEDTVTLEADALGIAKAFHAKGNFQDIFGRTPDEIEKKSRTLISSFEKNVQLLVEKTWVDQSGEELKDDILYRLSMFCKAVDTSYAHAQYGKEFQECISVLKDVVLLLFGQQTTSSEFVDYAFRIDPEFGLFWYYLVSFSDVSTLSTEKARLAMFLGMYFLANF